MIKTLFKFSIVWGSSLLVFGCGGLLRAEDASLSYSKDKVYDTEAQAWVDRSLLAADDVAEWGNGLENGTEQKYYEEMDKFGPKVIPILIRRFDSIKDHSLNPGFQRLFIYAIADAVVRYDGSATRPMGMETRQQALKFLISLLGPAQDHYISGFAIVALQRCAAKANITEPFVIEAVCDFLERGDVDVPAYDIALEVISVIGHGEAVARRVENAVNQVVVAHPTPGIGQDETLRLARQTVQTIRERANSPAAR